MVTQVNLSISLADVKFEYRNSKQTLMYRRSTTNDENGNTIVSFCGSTAESIYYILLDPAIKSQDEGHGSRDNLQNCTINFEIKTFIQM